MTKLLAVLVGAGILLLTPGCDDGAGSHPSFPTPTPTPIPAACLAAIQPANLDPNRPAIGLNGPRVVAQPVGVPYVDAGATASDPVEGNISSRMVVSGLETLSTAARGDYLVRYNVRNSLGSAASEAVRVVRVTDGQFARQTRRDYGTTSAIMGYFEHLPADYSDDPGRTFPVIIYNHGIGEDADFIQTGAGQYAPSPNKLDLLLRRGLSGIIDHGTWDDSRPFIVLSPQRCLSFGDGHEEAFVEYALNTYQADPSRVYMMGFSAGAFVTWEHVLLNPNQLAAAVTISGGGNTSPGAGCVMKDTPTWSFHAADDPTVLVADTINTVASMRACSPTVPHRLTIYPTGGHLIDIETLELTAMGQGEPQYDPYDQDLYGWLLEFTRPSGGSGNTAQTARPLVPLISGSGMTFSVTPEEITVGRKAMLKWSTEDAESCLASGDWVGPRPVSGTELVAPSAAGFYNYVLTCTAPDGSIARSVALEARRGLDVR
jgi:predicted esterase